MSGITNESLLDGYSELIKEHFCDNSNGKELSERFSALDNASDSAEEFLRLPYLKRRLKLSRTEYLALIIALVYETESGLSSVGEPKLAHALELSSKLYGKDYGGFETFDRERLFSLLWVNNPVNTEVRPFIATPLFLRREALAFILRGQIEQSAFIKAEFLEENDYAPVYDEVLGKIERDLSLGLTPLISGVKGTGKKTLIKRLAAKLSIPVIFAGGNAEPESALLNVVISGAVLCLNNVKFFEIYEFWKNHAPFVMISDYEETKMQFFDCEYHLPKVPDMENTNILLDFLAQKYCFEINSTTLSKKCFFSLGEIAAFFKTLKNADDLKDFFGFREVNLFKKCGFGASINDFHGDDIKQKLELICLYAEKRDEIFGSYGIDDFDYGGKGVCVLFHGPSGTGKTMASHILADMMGLPLMKVSLSAVFDKYVGETEKNIEKIFEAARGSVILFDEADSLFSKRSEVSSSHDKYANLPTSLLLQKTEEYDGIVILTTNLIGSLDDAFLRRMSFVVRFPYLGEREREDYWRKLLARSAASDVDFPVLAKTELSPARINEIVKLAAVLAFRGGKEFIGSGEIAEATKDELEKSGSGVIR